MAQLITCDTCNKSLNGSGFYSFSMTRITNAQEMIAWDMDLCDDCFGKSKFPSGLENLRRKDNL